jgi:hypothetical protein
MGGERELKMRRERMRAGLEGDEEDEVAAVPEGDTEGGGGGGARRAKRVDAKALCGSGC